MDQSTGIVAVPVAMARVRAAVDELVDSIRDTAVRDLSHDELGALSTDIRAQQARLDAVLLAAVGEVDARGSYAHEGALGAGAWLRARTRASAAEAAATVRTARTLRTGLLPGTAAALAAGQISARHAQVIADGIHATGASRPPAGSDTARRGLAPPAAIALIEPEVLDVARHGDPRAASTVMTAFQHALDPAADQAALRRYQRRGLTLAPTLDGAHVLTGLADEGSAAVLHTATTRPAPSSPATRALPCPAHHTACHEGGWTLHRLPDGRYHATHRDGRTIGPEPHPPGRNRPTRPPPRE